MANTVKASNISSKATLKQIEEFFSCSGQIESINLTSEGDELQAAYVTFMDKDSVKIALLLSGAVILDHEVTVAPCSNSETGASTAEPATKSPQAQSSTLTKTRPKAINRAQEIVKTMLSRGISLGKDTVRRAHSLEEKSNNATDGDAAKEIRNGGLHRQKNNDSELGDDTHILREVENNPGKGQYKESAYDDTNHSAEGDISGTVGDISDKDDDGGDKERSEGNRQGKWGSNNVRMGMQKCYEHVCAVNDKLQLGHRTMSVVTTAQQGVSHASSAVVNNKFISAGGGWVSSALSRVSSRTSNSLPHPNCDGNFISQEHEHVQLTEMTTMSSCRKENK